MKLLLLWVWQIPRWSSSTWLEVGREMTPQLDTVARSLISEPPLTPPLAPPPPSVLRASCHSSTPILMVLDPNPPPPSLYYPNISG